MRTKSSIRRRRCCSRIVSVGALCTVLVLFGSVYIGLEWQPVTDSVLEAYKAVADFAYGLEYEENDEYEKSDSETEGVSNVEKSVKETKSVERREIVSDAESTSSTTPRLLEPKEVEKSVEETKSVGRHEIVSDAEPTSSTTPRLLEPREVEKSVEETKSVRRREIVSDADSTSSTTPRSLEPQVAQPQVAEDKPDVNKNEPMGALEDSGPTERTLEDTLPTEGRRELVASISNAVANRSNRRAALSPCTDDMCRLFRETLLQGGLGSPVESPVESPVFGSANERTFSERTYRTQFNVSSDDDVDHLCDAECVSFRALLSTWPINKPKAVIYFFIQQTTLTTFRQAVRSVDRQFNRQFRYPIVVFITPEFDSQVYRQNIRNMIGSAPNYIQTVRLASVSKRRIQGRRRRKKQVGSTAETADACRFHAGLVYETPIFRSPGLEYLLRLSEDWLMAAQIKFDMFKVMKTQGFRYGFWRVKKMFTSADVKLCAAIEPYMNSSVALRSTYQGWRSHPTRYDCKWELSALSLWQSTNYRDYFSYVDQLGEIHSDRCSESAIKSIGVSLFTSHHQRHRFRDVYYVHSIAAGR